MQSEVQQLVGKKILFATAPADGHVNPLTGLAKYLQQAGCDVRWYTSTIYANKLRQLAIPHYIFKKARDINGQNIDEMLPERKLITDPVEKFDYDLRNLFIERALEYYDDLQEIHQSFSFDLLIADNAFSASPLVRHNMHIPVVAIGVFPLPQDSINLPPYGMALPPAVDIAGQEQYRIMKDFGTNMLLKKSVDSYETILQNHQISAKRANLFEVLVEQANLYLQIGVPSFEYERSDLAANVRFIGALLPYANKSQRQPWFDERLQQYKQVLLVTQGTVESDTDKLLEPTLEAFKDSNFFVIVTTGGNGTDILRSKYPQKNILIEDIIPFNEVMPYATIFITNGGYGGTILAAQHGLPMVAAGVHEGKNAVCARIGYLSYGIDLQTETPTPTQLREAVEKIISNHSYTENVAHLAKEFGHFDAFKLSVHYITQLLGLASETI